MQAKKVINDYYIVIFHCNHLNYEGVSLINILKHFVIKIITSN